MKIIAPAKINLMLHFVGRRNDGYHLMQSAVAFADIGDELDIEPAEQFSLTIDGPFAAHAPAGDDNLVTRAAAGARIAVKLTKNIPAGAGLGGGSADAAAILKYLGTQSRALELGADVPVSTLSTATWMEGVGDVLAPVDMDPLHAVLLWPDYAMPTPRMYDAYRTLNTPFHPVMAKPARIDMDFLSRTQNDFTNVAVAELQKIKHVLYEFNDLTNPILARMSGSGSACFALYDSREGSKKAADVMSAAYPDLWVRACILS